MNVRERQTLYCRISLQDAPLQFKRCAGFTQQFHHLFDHTQVATWVVGFGDERSADIKKDCFNSLSQN